VADFSDFFVLFEFFAVNDSEGRLDHKERKDRKEEAVAALRSDALRSFAALPADMVSGRLLRFLCAL
jgi:hypothetical protein